MSTTTVYVQSAEEVELERLRAEQAAALAAAQRAAAVAAQQQRYMGLASELDAARAQLPDLGYTLPAFPSTDNPSEARRVVDAMQGELRAAIVEARAVLVERGRRQEAWHALHERRDAANAEISLCHTTATAAQTSFTPSVPPAMPETAAHSSQVFAAVQEYDRYLAGLRRQREDLEAQARTRAAVRAHAGTEVKAVSAIDKLDAWSRQQVDARIAKARSAIESALARYHFSRADLPSSLQAFISAVVDGGHDAQSATDWIGRHHARLTERAKAQALLKRPPEILDTPALAQGWLDLLQRLQAVIDGLLPWGAELELAWNQLHADSRAEASRAFLRARFLVQAQNQGFAVTDGAEDGLVVLDLKDLPGYWLEVRKEELEDGTVANVTELRADTNADPARDKAATEAVCKAMEKLASGSGQGALTEEIERTATVRRTRRPARRAFASSL
jgi:hypothetical protein